MTIPTKTALGNEELRSRTQRLGQRHRTILFLVDGRRPLSEVLHLAQQAGAATSHFEDLIRLGLVEVPVEPSPPAPAPPETVPPGNDALLLTSIELEVPAESPEDVASEGDSEPDVAAKPYAAPLLTEVVSLPPVSGPLEAAAPAIAAPVPAAKPAPAVASRARKPSPIEPPVLGEDVAVPTADAADAALLQRVRELLIDTLRLDAPLFSARTFVRVRSAQTTTELIELVWEIENHMVRARHARRELLSLERARELLGLGNTLVADDDSRPPHLDE